MVSAPTLGAGLRRMGSTPPKLRSSHAERTFPLVAFTYEAAICGKCFWTLGGFSGRKCLRLGLGGGQRVSMTMVQQTAASRSERF